MRQEMVLGPRDHPESNPLARRETEVKILALESSAETFDGDDGTRIGYEHRVNAEYQLVSAKDGVEIPVTGFLPWLFGYDTWLEISAEGDIGEGGGVGHGDYYDRRDNRHHYRFYWGLGVLPVDLELDFKVGKRDQDPEPVVSWPNLIVTGEATVLIG